MRCLWTAPCPGSHTPHPRHHWVPPNKRHLVSSVRNRTLNYSCCCGDPRFLPRSGGRISWVKCSVMMYSSYSFMTSALDGVSGQRHASAALYTRGKDPRYPLDRTPGTLWTGGWVDPRSGLGTEAKGIVLLPLPGIEPWSPGRTVRSQTLYWPSCPGSRIVFVRVPMQCSSLLVYTFRRSAFIFSKYKNGVALRRLSPVKLSDICAHDSQCVWFRLLVRHREEVERISGQPKGVVTIK
jgi:hypothetical protein